MAITQPAPSKAEVAGTSPASLGTYLAELERSHPEAIVHVTEPVNPARFEVTAVLQRLEDLGRYPAVVFDQPLDLNGRVSDPDYRCREERPGSVMEQLSVSSHRLLLPSLRR